MINTLKLRSGATIRRMSREQALAKNYLTREILSQIHLIPGGEPIAFACDEDAAPLHDVVFFFDPENVKEAPPELWYFPDDKHGSMTLPSGSVIRRMSGRRAAACGYYTVERLDMMKYKPIEEPVAYSQSPEKGITYFYDKRTAERLPLPCIQCGAAERYRKKLCRDCYEKEMEQLRIEDDLKRGTYYHMSRDRVLFFDLELTGFYDHDEILSISIVDGNGTTVMNTLVKPVRNKKWKKTEKVHGITPEMVTDAPLLADLIPELKDIFEKADRLIAYGVSTDYSHIKYIYDTEEEREALHDKVRCCANEFVRYAHTHHPEVQHASLTDAMACLGIDWEGIAHTSMADTFACRNVWERLFPYYYDDPVPAGIGNIAD